MARRKISDAFTVEGGKIIQEIPQKQLENRKTRIEEQIANIDDQIADLEKQKTGLQTDIADIDGLLSQLS